MVHMNDIPAWEYNAERRLKDHLAWRLAYIRGYREPRYPVPAIPLLTVWPSDGYLGCVYIDDLSNGEDDPMMVRGWDFWEGKSMLYWWSERYGMQCEDF
jgi:hypothetical protein